LELSKYSITFIKHLKDKLMDKRLALKSFLSGIIGGLVYYAGVQWLLSSGFAPFNVAPTKAFLLEVGVSVPYLVVIINIIFGALMAMLLGILYGPNINIGNGISLGFSLWLLLMLALSPIVGWGVFGVGDAEFLDKTDIFYLQPGWSYPLLMLLLHVLYGLICGILITKWGARHLMDDE